MLLYIFGANMVNSPYSTNNIEEIDEKSLFSILPQKKLDKMGLNAIEQVDNTLSRIESALESYKLNVKGKLKGRFNSLLYKKSEELVLFHDKLADWEKNMLRARTNRDFFKMYLLLQNLVDICDEYSLD